MYYYLSSDIIINVIHHKLALSIALYYIFIVAIHNHQLSIITFRHLFIGISISNKSLLPLQSSLQSYHVTFPSSLQKASWLVISTISIKKNILVIDINLRAYLQMMSNLSLEMAWGMVVRKSHFF